jgi:hypothetical protein
MRFREKPDAESAAAFVEAGPDRYLWNSGMFVWRTGRFLELASRYEPELTASVSRIAAAAALGLDQAMISAYPGLKRISVDYGHGEGLAGLRGAYSRPPPRHNLEGHSSWIAYGDLMERDGSDNRRSAKRRSSIAGHDRPVIGRRAPRRLSRLRGPVVIHTAGRPWSARNRAPTSLKNSTRKSPG